MSELPSVSENIRHSEGYLGHITTIRAWDKSPPNTVRPWRDRSEMYHTKQNPATRWRYSERIAGIMADEDVWSQSTLDTPLCEMVEMLETQKIPSHYPEAFKTELDRLLPQLSGFTRIHLQYATLMHGERLAERIQRDPASRVHKPLPNDVLSAQYKMVFQYDELVPDYDRLHLYPNVTSSWKSIVPNSKDETPDQSTFAKLTRLIEIGFREIEYWPGYMRYLNNEAIKNVNIDNDSDLRVDCLSYGGFCQKRIEQVRQKAQQRVEELDELDRVLRSDEKEPPATVFTETYDAVARALKARKSSGFELGTDTGRPIDAHLMRQPLFAQALALAREAMPEASEVIGKKGDGPQQWGKVIGAKTQRHMSDEVWRALGAFAQWQVYSLSRQTSSRVLELYREPPSTKSDLYRAVCASEVLTKLLRQPSPKAADKPLAGPDISDDFIETTKQEFFQGVLCIVAALDCIHPLWTNYVTEYAYDMDYGYQQRTGKLKNQVPAFPYWLQNIYRNINRQGEEDKWVGLQEILGTIGFRTSYTLVQNPIHDGSDLRWRGLEFNPPQSPDHEPPIEGTLFSSAS